MTDLTIVTLDTNIVVSANLIDAGPSAAIFRLALNQRLIQMCVSPAVLAEYEKVLRRPRFKFTTTKVDQTLTAIRAAARLVHPTKTLHISQDEADNRFYECADEAKADYLITGNTQDFGQDYGLTKIITPRDFLDQVIPSLFKDKLESL